MYKELFYLTSSFVMKFKSVREPEFSTFVFISVLIVFNMMTIFTFLGYLFDVNLYRDYNINYIYVYLPLSVLVLIINYITIYSKRKTIFKEYSSQNRINKYKTLLYKLYIFASFILLFVSFSFNQTLFDKDVNLKNHDNKIIIPELDFKGDPSKSYK